MNNEDTLLGNHEFWGRPFEETLEEARNQTVEAPNVHILDVKAELKKRLE
ncbi:MAG: hypothetical protein IKO65_07715 [Victivallales bacterium]|nr:hypothetical protein [Victivallales bacterium]